MNTLRRKNRTVSVATGSTGSEPEPGNKSESEEVNNKRDRRHLAGRHRTFICQAASRHLPLTISGGVCRVVSSRRGLLAHLSWSVSSWRVRTRACIVLPHSLGHILFHIAGLMCGEIQEKGNKNPMSCLPETFYNEAFCCSALIKPQQKTHSGFGE